MEEQIMKLVRGVDYSREKVWIESWNARVVSSRQWKIFE